EIDHRGRGAGSAVRGQRVRAVDDVLGARRRGLPGLERVHELAGDADGIAHGAEDRGRTLQRVLDDPVEQVLDGPREFADVAGTDQAAGALERVEGAAHAGERFRLQRVLFPGREQLGDAGDLLARLFYI